MEWVAWIPCSTKQSGKLIAHEFRYMYLLAIFDPLVVGINIWIHYGSLGKIAMQTNIDMVASFQFIFKSIESDWIIMCVVIMRSLQGM